MRATLTKVVTVLAIVGLVSAAPAGAQSKEQLVLQQPAGPLVSAGNGIYRVLLEDSQFSGTCGRWTAATAALHPAGPGRAVLYGGDFGFPGTSYTTLRSYNSGVDYTTGTTCTNLCSVAVPFAPPVLIDEPNRVGYRFVWTFPDGVGPTIELTQTVVVEGPRDGTETVNNTAIRETHTVRNLGPGAFSYGLRKMWDWAIGGGGAPIFDDGPWFGDCETPLGACDRSMNLTGDGSLDGFYPRSYTINEDPQDAICPAGVVPNNAAGCGGAPIYIVAGTVAPPAALTPAPDPPEMLQFNNWGQLFSSCWQPTLFDAAFCGGGDTAAAYFYGRTAGSAETLAVDEARSYTQYVVAAEESCPDIIGTVVADIDVKFCSDPNGFNCRKRGVLPVTVFGSDSLDVAEIDFATLQLCLASDPSQCTAMSPRDWSFADRGDPTTDLGASQCQVIDGVEQDFLNPDGFVDVDVAFEAREVAELIGCGSLSKGDESPTLVLVGQLLSGVPLQSVPVDDVGIDRLLIQRAGGSSLQAAAPAAPVAPPEPVTAPGTAEQPKRTRPAAAEAALERLREELKPLEVGRDWLTPLRHR